jgi:hypothetical protein
VPVIGEGELVAMIEAVAEAPAADRNPAARRSKCRP